ncbi:hypothetical protein [Salmonella phage SD-6_S16]|nr:hypothetical protein [Salmonella phage SD-6_S16]
MLVVKQSNLMQLLRLTLLVQRVILLLVQS